MQLTQGAVTLTRPEGGGFWKRSRSLGLLLFQASWRLVAAAWLTSHLGF